MTTILNINKILAEINNYAANSRITKNILEYEVKQRAIDGDNENYFEHIKICVELGLLEYDNNEYHMTLEGNTYFKLIIKDGNEKIIDNITNEQKNNITYLVLNSTNLRSRLESLISNAYVDFTSSPIWVISENQIPKKDKELIELLYAIDFFKDEKTKIKIQNIKPEIISTIKNKMILTDDELTELLLKQKENGSLAEDKTIQYEKKRLEFEGDFDLASAVKKISTIDVCAGYDIKSYTGNNRTFEYDRFIEVKSTTSNKPKFFWSVNEINTAKKLGEKYWVYLWINFNTKNEVMIPIPNPYETIWNNKMISKEPQHYLVSYD